MDGGRKVGKEGGRKGKEEGGQKIPVFSEDGKCCSLRNFKASENANVYTTALPLHTKVSPAPKGIHLKITAKSIAVCLVSSLGSASQVGTTLQHSESDFV